jgi:hypothetical protein
MFLRLFSSKGYKRVSSSLAIKLKKVNIFYLIQCFILFFFIHNKGKNLHVHYFQSIECPVAKFRRLLTTFRQTQLITLLFVT